MADLLRAQIVQADVSQPWPLPNESVQCIVTSPPYWGLRDYGLPPSVWGGDPGCAHAWGPWHERHDQRESRLSGKSRTTDRCYGAPSRRFDGNHQKHSHGALCERCGAWLGVLGLEPSPTLYVEHLVWIMREAWRVLRKDGTLWLNLGDSYCSDGGAGGTMAATGLGSPGRAALPRPEARDPDAFARWRRDWGGLKRKDLVGMPWRVAFALQAEGWYLRSDIIWAKPNPMPESVTDRPTRAHEDLFLLTKRERYYYDADAIRQPHAEETLRSFGGGRPRARAYGKAEHQDPTAKVASGGWGANQARRGQGRFIDVRGANRRTVWTVPTEPFPDTHFAVFPKALVEPCVLAGTSEAGCCQACGAPRVRVTERSRSFESGSGRSGRLPTGKHGPGLQGGGATVDVRRGPVVHVETVGWQPSCACGAPAQPCTVLDPFAGAGTTLLVAHRLGRHSVGLELSPDYCAMATRRLAPQLAQTRLPFAVAAQSEAVTP